MLSQQAAKLRSSIGDEELRKSYDGFEDMPTSSTLGFQAAQLEARVFEEVGPALFFSDDFEVLQQLGRISVMRDARLTPSGQPEGTTAVIAYAGRFLPRLPLQRSVPVLLKEYLPVAHAVAYNELLVLHRLLGGLPQDTYEAANSLTSRHPPVVPLLGYFVSAPTDEAAALSMDAEADSIWLVYRWEGLKPLNMYMDAAEPPKGQASFFKKKEVAEAEAWAARHLWLRSLSRGLVAAVAHCHGSGVVHGSLSSGTVFVSSVEDRDARELYVKLDNFGFGRLDPTGGVLGLSGPQLPGLDLDATAPQEGRRFDMQAVALVLMEVFAAGTATSAAGALPRATLTRLMFDIYDNDVDALRSYCTTDPELEGLVGFLDQNDRAGWDFVEQLLRGKKTSGEMRLHRFVAL